MERNQSTLLVLNKIAMATPFILLIGCDGGREDEGSVALGATIVLAFSLNWLEARYRRPWTLRRAWALACLCVATVALVATVELEIFSAIGKLHGPIGVYGIPSTILVLSATLLFCTCACGWADARAQKQ